MDQTLIFFLAAVIIVGALIFALTLIGDKNNKKINVEYYRTKCLQIEHQLKREDASSYQLTVVKADKLLDQALKDLRFKGGTTAERMKSASERFSDRNGIWSAHKLRNVIAHDVSVDVKYEDAKMALVSFRQALKDLGAI